MFNSMVYNKEEEEEDNGACINKKLSVKMEAQT